MPGLPLALGLLLAVACGAAPPKVRRENQADPVVDRVVARSRAFLDAYARDDVAGVESMLDAHG